jgi:hypothetical protein
MFKELIPILECGGWGTHVLVCRYIRDVNAETPRKIPLFTDP